MLIEREASLARLYTLTEQLTAGRGSIVLVSGEAGIGKTTLLQAFAQAIDGQFLVKWGICDPVDPPRVLGPFQDMSHHLTPPTQELLASGANVSQIIPSLLAELKSAEKPNIVVVEDTHWADNATLDTLKCIGRRISFLNTLLVLSFRNDQADVVRSLSMVLADFPPAETHRIELKPISAKGVARMAASMQRSDVGVFEVTQGNPFYVTELLASKTSLEEAVPASVQDAINARMIRLPETVQQFLETISLFPYPVESDIIHHLYGGGGAELLDNCVALGLMVNTSEGEFRFRHELARLGTLSRVPPGKQMSLHKKVVEFLIRTLAEITKSTGDAAGNRSSQLGLWHERLVYHAGSCNKHELVLEHASKAAEIASGRGAHVEAASYLQTALKLVEYAKTEQAATLYENWAYEVGLVKVDASTIAARNKALALWRELDRPDKIGENLRWLSRLHWYRGESDIANRYLDAAMKTLESTDPSVERATAYSLKAQYHMLNDRMSEAIEWGLKALEIEEQYPSVEVKVHALNSVGTAYLFRDELIGLEYMQTSLDLAIQHKLHEQAARVYTNLSDYAVNARDFVLAEKTIEEGIAFDSSHDLDSWTYYLTGYLAQLRLEQGRLEEAETIAQGVMALDDQTLLMKLPALLVLSRVRLRIGSKNALNIVEQALRDALSTGEAQYIVPARLSLVEYAWLSNQLPVGVEQLEELSALNDLPEGKWRSAELHIWYSRFGLAPPQPDTHAIASPYQQELAGDFQSAAQEWLNLHSPYQAALCLLQGDLRKADDRLTQATQLLENMRAHGTAKKIDQLRHENHMESKVPALRRGPQKSARQHPLGLTKKEQEVLPLIVRGCSNKEISIILNRSTRTIENHVAAILKKFKVSNRMDVMLRVKNAPWLMQNESPTSVSEEASPQSTLTPDRYLQPS